MESNELIQVNMDHTKIASPMNTLMILKTGLNFIHIRATKLITVGHWTMSDKICQCPTKSLQWSHMMTDRSNTTDYHFVPED